MGLIYNLNQTYERCVQTFNGKPLAKWLLIKPRWEYLRRIMFGEEESEGSLKSLWILITGNHSFS
jgi:hypothetical protein